MLTVLLLTGIEKLINLAIASDKITQSGLQPLSGKVLRLNMQVPKLSIDVLFNEDHLRFEPVVTDSVFEPKGSDLFTEDTAGTVDMNTLHERKQAQQSYASLGHDEPDCTITVANVAELLNLMRAPEGNLPIEGDYKVLMQVKQLIAGFDPDIAGQLEPLIGVPLASQLGLLINQLKGSVKQTAKHTFADVSDWANEVAGNAKVDPEQEAEVNDLKQQLLRLRADIEREEARLAAIKAEQQKYRQD
ncbi:ubiquinone biosynthesis accessory factor UbiJ [Psychrobacter sp. I-STPA10]|uniref:ubiquinone biosynthesis accessory factor UbiJ n=1 Tax=Psychrobacter sp. I-STPA10 TaxID=2585769 RepID=UPI001E478DEA|nr:hypothetical protein [Psychrobacter sp. I-STPA10]